MPRPRGSSELPLRPLLIAVCILGGALLFYTWRWQSAADFASSIDHGGSLFLDFERYYHPVGQSILVDPRPPSGYLYSPSFALLLNPIARLPLPLSMWIWGALQVVFVFLTLSIPARHLASHSASAFYLYVALVATSFPYLHNFVWGQVSVLLLATVLGALYLYRAGHKDLSSLVLALGASVKLYTVVLLFYFVLKREWRYLGVFVSVFVFVTVLVPAAVLGASETLAFYRDVGVVLRDAQTIFLRDVNSQSFVSVVYRAFSRAISLDQVVYLRAAGLAVFLTSCFAVWRVIATSSRNDALWGFALILLSIPFVVSSSWPHYFVYLPYVQALFVSELLLGGWSPRRTAVLLLVLLPSIVMSSSFFFLKVDRWYDYSRGNYLFFSNALLLLYAWARVARDR